MTTMAYSNYISWTARCLFHKHYYLRRHWVYDIDNWLHPYIDELVQEKRNSIAISVG